MLRKWVEIDYLTTKGITKRGQILKGIGNRANRNKLSIYLIKSDIDDKDIIFENSKDIRELKKYSDDSIAYSSIVSNNLERAP